MNQTQPSSPERDLPGKALHWFILKTFKWKEQEIRVLWPVSGGNHDFCLWRSSWSISDVLSRIGSQSVPTMCWAHGSSYVYPFGETVCSLRNRTRMCVSGT